MRAHEQRLHQIGRQVNVGKSSRPRSGERGQRLTRRLRVETQGFGPGALRVRVGTVGATRRVARTGNAVGVGATVVGATRVRLQGRYGAAGCTRARASCASAGVAGRGRPFSMATGSQSYAVTPARVRVMLRMAL